MPKFTFHLEGVLRHRKHIEQERQRAVAESQHQFGELQTELRSLEQSVQQANDDLRQHHLTGKLDMTFISGHRRFMIAMQRKGMGLAQKMALAQRQLDELRQQLAEAAKERKIMEKLREKHFARWREAIMRKELAELDEVGMQLTYAHLGEEGAES